MIVEMETISLVECVSTRTWGQVSLHKIYTSGFEIYLEVRWKAYSKKVQTHWKTDFKFDPELTGYWCNKHLIELHKLQEQDCKSFLRTKLPTATASSQSRTPDLATTTRTWLKDNKETGMCPAALAAGRVRPRPRPPKTPGGWSHPLTGQLGSGRSEVKDPGEVAEHVHWRRALLRTPTPLQLWQRRTRRRSLPPPRADDPNLGWTTGGTFAGIAPRLR